MGAKGILSQATALLTSQFARLRSTRRTRLYCVGAAKTGTHSVASMFDAPTLKPDEWPTRLELISARVQDDGNVWLRYRVVQE